MALRLQTPTGTVRLSTFARRAIGRPGRAILYPGYVCQYCGEAIRGRYGEKWHAIKGERDMSEYCFPPSGDALVISYHYPRA